MISENTKNKFDKNIRIEKLKELGFEEGKYSREKALMLSVRGTDRFTTDFVYYEDEDKIYVNRHFLRGLETISLEEIEANTNNLHSTALETYKNIKAIEGVKWYSDKISDKE